MLGGREARSAGDHLTHQLKQGQRAGCIGAARHGGIEAAQP